MSTPARTASTLAQRVHLYAVSRVHVDYAGRQTLLDYGRVEAVDPADAVRVAHGLERRPAMRHDGECSGYAVRGLRYVATAVSL